MSAISIFYLIDRRLDLMRAFAAWKRGDEMNTFPFYAMLLCSFIVIVVILGLDSPWGNGTLVCSYILLKLYSGWHKRTFDPRWQ